MPKLKSKEFIIQSKLLEWYKINKRILPWRKLNSKKLPNPYYVIISEFMLQQTTVNSVIKRFNEFIKKWPNLKKLSNTNESQILKFWSGLGYYTRARNLLKSAKIISNKYNYKIPSEYDELIALPGIGDYSAKAILGIAFNKPFMPIDSNVKRILARIYGITKRIESGQKKILIIAENYISKKKSNQLIQAFMDYGSTICLSRNPKCNICIISKFCVAKKNNLIEKIANQNKSFKGKKTKYTNAYIFLNQNKEILVRKRPPTGMLASMLELPNDNWKSKKNELIKDNILKKFNNKLFFYSAIIYPFSHFDLKVDIFLTNVKKCKVKDHRWILLKNVDKSGMPTMMKKILEELNI